jgi:hypothetical protein
MLEDIDKIKDHFLSKLEKFKTELADKLDEQVCRFINIVLGKYF